MIITDAHGIGTELGLWPTLTHVFVPPVLSLRGRTGGTLCTTSSLRRYLARMWGDKINNLASGLLDSLARHIYYRPAIHLAQT
jgi:hypothetical protein